VGNMRDHQPTPTVNVPVVYLSTPYLPVVYPPSAQYSLVSQGPHTLVRGNPMQSTLSQADSCLADSCTSPVDSRFQHASLVMQVLFWRCMKTQSFWETPQANSGLAIWRPRAQRMCGCDTNLDKSTQRSAAPSCTQHQRALRNWTTELTPYTCWT
jgi:hypothetical protein